MDLRLERCGPNSPAVSSDDESRRYSEIEMARAGNESGRSKRMRPSVDVEGMAQPVGDKSDLEQDGRRSLMMEEDDGLPMMDDDFPLRADEEGEYQPIHAEEDGHQQPVVAMEEDHLQGDGEGVQQSAVADISLNASVENELVKVEGKEEVDAEDRGEAEKHGRRRKKRVGGSTAPCIFGSSFEGTCNAILS